MSASAANAMTDTGANLEADAVRPLGYFERTRILVACVVAVLLLTSVGWMVVRPVDPAMAVTFMHGERSVLAVWPAVLVLTLVAGTVGTVIAGPRLPEAGALAAGVGLAGLALRGGSMESLLGYSAGPSAEGRRALMVAMGFDALLWGLILLATWFAVMFVYRWLWPAGDDETLRADDDEEATMRIVRVPAAIGWPAFAVTTVVGMFVIYLTIARSPVAPISRGQVIASVFGAMYLGAMAARYFTGIHDARWYMLAPLATSLVGYLVGYLQANLGWAKGATAVYALLATTPPHPLMRPLPIEYLAVGLAGAIVGYWSGHKIEEVTVEELS